MTCHGGVPGKPRDPSHGGPGRTPQDTLVPAPEPVLGLLRCACRASSGASLADASYSQRPQLAPV